MVCAPRYEKVICLSLVQEALSSALSWKSHIFQSLSPLPCLKGTYPLPDSSEHMGQKIFLDIQQLKTHRTYLHSQKFTLENTFFPPQNCEGLFSVFQIIAVLLRKLMSF